MAKRAAPDEQPYRPLLDVNLAAVLAQPAPAIPELQEASGSRGIPKVLNEISRQEVPKAVEIVRQNRFEPAAQSIAPVPRQAPGVLGEKFDSEKRILFTRSESQSLDRLVTSLARRLNAQVKTSHVIRALIALALNAEGEVERRAGEVPPLVRPPNGDGQALQRFEKEIASIIGAALRDSPPLRF